MNNSSAPNPSTTQSNPRQFTSNYTIIKELGRGAFSTVYKVQSIKTSKIYCVKKIAISNTTPNLNEITILKHLNSPSPSKINNHLVNYYDSYTEENYLYIIMEYCQYGDLYSLLHSVQKHHLYINEEILWNIAYQSLLALQFLHKKNIIHRDIKWWNIFMTDDKIIKIGDMGMSKLIDNDKKMNMSRVGTPLYLPPELVKKESYDYKVDIWSLGCSLYHWAKLVPPFNEENWIKWGDAIVNQKQKPLPDIYSKEFCRLVDVMMEKDKKVRVSAKRAIDNYVPEKIKSKYYEKYGKLWQEETGNNLLSNDTNISNKSCLKLSYTGIWNNKSDNNNNNKGISDSSRGKVRDNNANVINEKDSNHINVSKNTDFDFNATKNTFIFKRHFNFKQGNHKRYEGNSWKWSWNNWNSTQDTFGKQYNNWHIYNSNNISNGGNGTNNQINKESNAPASTRVTIGIPPQQKIQTCNNFYNININVLKINIDKKKLEKTTKDTKEDPGDSSTNVNIKQSLSLNNKAENKTSVIFPTIKVNSRITFDQSNEINNPLKLRRKEAQSSGLLKANEMRKTFNKLTIYDLK